MGKDKSILTTISKLFTEETLKNVLIEATGYQNIEVTGWELQGTTPKGESYLSTVNKLLITGIVNGVEKDLKVIVKQLPINLGRRKTYRSADFFYNETIFYTKIVPMFKKFLNEKNQSHLLSIPKCLAYVLDGENDFIVLEDVTVYGFKPASKNNNLNVEVCKSILKGMARFHGISFAHKSQNEAKFYEAADQLKETYFSEDHWNWYKGFHSLIADIAKDAISKEYGGTPEGKRFCSIDSRKFWEASVRVCGRSKTPTSVINQGDAWVHNFLIRTLESGENEALLLDFQLARCAGPVSDLAFFIYSCTDDKLRESDFNNLLKYYHDEVANTISKLGSDPYKVYPWKTFMKEVQEDFVHGMNFGFESIPLSMLDENTVYDADIIKGNDAVDITEIWKLQPIENKEKRKRLADVIMHAMKHGFI